MNATITPFNASNDQSSRRGIFRRYEDVIEEEVIPKAPTLEAACRIFQRQMSNARLRKMRRALINIKRTGSISGR
jgi:hypothetical protein